MALDPGEEAGRERVTPPSLVELVLAGAVGGGSGTRQVPPESGRSRPARGYDVIPLLERDVEPVAEFAVFGLPRYGREEPDWPQRRIAELTGSEGALGEFLATLPPGPRLATLLAAVDLDAVDEFTLVEVVAAFKRMEAWSAARAARAAATLAERPALNPTWPGTLPGRTRGECVAGEELALRLRASRLTAVRLAACGRAFRAMFQSTGAALEEGLIDWARAQAIVTTLEGLPTDVAMAAQWEVLEKAPGRTLRQVHADLAKAIIAVDPDSADDRHRAAREKRCVDHPQPLPDGMAKVCAVLPAADAIALDTALEAAARAARNTGDPRTLDQLRADALSLMAHSALVLGHIGPNAGAHCACCREGGDDPHPPSRGPSASGMAPTTAPNATDPPPATGPSATDPPPASGFSAADPQPRTGPNATDPPPTTGPSATDPPPTTGGSSFVRPPVDPAPPRPGERLPGRRLPTIRLGSLGGGRADVRVTVPLGVLLPDPDAPLVSPLDRVPEPVAELEGYGPVPPVVARALAAGGVWRRLVTDPTGTEVLDVGRTRYQPTAAIADHVRERDRTCVRPGCSAPARGCDLDHEHEWHRGGVTSVENLGSLCRRDHVVKSIGAFTVAHGSDRTYAWTTPTGHGYLRRPDGTVVTLPHRTAEGLRVTAQRAARFGGRGVDPAVVDAVLAEVSAGTDVGGSCVPAGGPAVQSPWPGTEVGPSWSGDDTPPF